MVEKIRLIPDLRRANLSEVDLHGIDLSEAKLHGANLSGALLYGANLRNANLRKVNLKGAKLSGAYLAGAKLIGTDAREANFYEANLSEAKLNEANLSEAQLNRADLSRANLTDVNFSKAKCSATAFSGVDLSVVKGLEDVVHWGPSYIDVQTLYLSQGKIPDTFLRGCGVPETLITYLPSLTGKAIDFYSCFISYSHADKDFARLLHDRLQGQGIRCWLDEHQLNPGDKLHSAIYDAIRVYDKVILCCSKSAITSWWVEKEFENAVSKEEDYRDTVLIPVDLDGYLFGQSHGSWVIGEIKKRFVQGFADWKNHDAFEKAFQAVVKALRTDGGKLPPPEPKLKPKRKKG